MERLLKHRKSPLLTLDAYVGEGGMKGLAAARRAEPDDVVQLIQAAGLQGRGGAAFPTGRKWAAVRAALDPVRYVVVNADESEPGTFKDRVLLETDPFLVLEGLLIAAQTIGAGRAYIYIRGEFRAQADALEAAVEELHRQGHLADIPRPGESLAIEVRRGAGAYICGEETALLNSIEGRRGEPRSKPPFPTVRGLFGHPTLVNNVETLANVPLILAHGADWFRQAGTERSPGTKLFSVSGHARRPGVYEVPFGTPLEALIDLAGAPDNGTGAVLLGGAAGTFVMPDRFGVPLSPEGAAGAGLSLGSGAVIVCDRSTDLWRVAERVARFFAHESCGRCVPCRVGTERQCDLLLAFAEGRATGETRELLRDLVDVMTDASICGLGQTAGAAARSLLDAEEARLSHVR